MSQLEIRLLNSFTSLLDHLRDIIDDHPALVTLGIFRLLILLAVLMIVRGVQRRAKGFIRAGPRIIYVESVTPPPPEPAFDPLPPWRECDCEQDRDD